MSTSARKKALRQAEHAKQKALREYEKQFSKPRKTKREFVEYKMETPYVRETPYYPSLKSTSSVQDATRKAEPKRYTGTLVRGIATMHKSNAVPVISQQEAEDISKMRRN